MESVRTSLTSLLRIHRSIGREDEVRPMKVRRVVEVGVEGLCEGGDERRGR